MSRDIRSFFTVISKKSGTEAPKPVASANKKKAKQLLDSDDEDIIGTTPDPKKQKVVVLSSDSEDKSSRKKHPEKNKNASSSSKSKTQKAPEKRKHEVLSSNSEDESSKKKSDEKEGVSGIVKPKIQKPTEKKHKVHVISSDSEDDASNKKVTKPVEKKKENEPKLKPVSVGDIFKKDPIKQSKVDPPKIPVEEKVKKEVKKTKSKKKGDRDKEKSVHNDENFEKTLDDLDDDIFENNMDELDRTVSELLAHDEEITKKNGNHSENQENKNTRKRSRTDSPERNTPKKKKIEHSDSGIDPGQEAHEKKRYSAMLYQKYLNRSGPKHLGMKELPKGKPKCLNNLCFLRTGVLDSLDSEEFDKLIKEHGGRVVHGVSKKVSYIVVGEDPGPSKLAKAGEYNIPSISEDELLDLILTKSGMKPKYSKSNSEISDDLGFETDNEVIQAMKDEEMKEGEHVKTKNQVEEKIKESKETKIEKTKDSPRKKKEESVIKDSEQISKESKTKEQSSGISSNSFYSQASTSKVKVSESAHKSSLSEDKPKTKSESVEVNNNLPLSEKYRPQTLKAVIGQQGERSNLYKLKNWLENWHKNQDPKHKKALVRPSPWAKNDDGGFFKCVLLSGPPGVGKTTSATLVAKELGFDIVEFNASDTRSKRLLHEEVSQLLHTKSVAGFATGRKDMNGKRVLLMDEVDGMAGNEDRGGIQELIQLIKNTSVPIICMCNDRNHQKMRSLVNYCYDLRFSKPRLEQIRGAMMSICFKEKIEISPQALSEIIAGTGCDVRQTLNHLAILGTTKEKITSEVAGKEAKSAKKDTIMGPWEVCRTVFTRSDHKDMSVADKARLFFYDYSLGPLFIHENYLKVQPEGADRKQTLLKAALAAAAISTGDIIDSKIRRSNNWALLESESMFSSVLPGHYMSGHFTSQINFPSWLGKNSKKGKFRRLQGDIHSHTRLSTSASKMAIKLDYLVPLRNAIVTPLQKKGMDGIDEAVSVMKEYNLLREDLDSLVELCSWSGKENPMSSVDTKVKTAFTRAYNKQVTLLPYAPTSGITKKKVAAAESDPYGEEEEAVSENEDEDDISKNAMIKVKKPKGKGKKGDEQPSTSKKNDNKKGKGKKK